MPKFSARSLEALASCDPRLIQLFQRVVERWDCVVLEGHRGEAAQNEAFEKGTSKLRWPDGNHNHLPSLAADVAPYPVQWGNRERFILFAGFVLGVASQLGIPLRWGGDWDSDGDTRDECFSDLVHFEIAEKR